MSECPVRASPVVEDDVDLENLREPLWAVVFEENTTIGTAELMKLIASALN